MADDWRQTHADRAEQMAQHPLVEDVLDEFASNMGFRREGLPEYGLAKIVSTVAQVTLARALGFEPDALRFSNEEANRAIQARARWLVSRGVPVMKVDSDGVTRLD